MSIPAQTKKNRFLTGLVLFCTFFCATYSILAQSLSFSTGNFPTQSGPLDAVPVDINGNGFPGVVTANFGFRFGGGPGTGGGSGNTLSVYTNDGTGSLSLGQTLTVGLEPCNIAVADFNGDGALDLVCANVGSNSVTVLTNNLRGGFALDRSYTVGSAPVFVAAVDINGDGFVDLICANYGSSTLTVLTNNGHGVFTFSSTINVGLDPSCLVAADINGDGSIDLVCVNSGANPATMQTFLNNGHGVFTSSATFSVPNGVGWAVGADVDSNGSIDLITTGGNTSLNVLTNDGRGNFSLKSSPPTFANSGVVAAADMNGDGKVDLVCTINNNGIQGSAEILTNDGTGNFSESTDVAIGYAGSVNYPNSIAVADFNGDGNADFVVACFGSAAFTEAQQISTPKPTVTITSPANDAVISSTASFPINVTATSASNIEAVIYFIGNHVGTNIFASTNAPFSVTIPAERLTPGTYSLQAEAVDSAGHIGWSPEVQITITGNSTNHGSGTPLTFIKASFGVGSGPVYILPVDLNGNGHLDLVTANFGFTYQYIDCVGAYGTGSNLTFCLNNGHGAFSSNYSASVGFNGDGFTSEPSCVAAADFNNNGKLELVTPSYDINQLIFLTNNSQGIFSEANVIGSPARQPIYITNADFNGDGFQDLVTANNFDTNITVLTNTGFGSFSNSARLPVMDKPVWVAVADVNGDGLLDLISANYGNCGIGNTLSVYTNAGRGNFALDATLTVGYGPVCVVAADVNGDGFADLISANQDENSLSVLINDGHGNFTLQSTIPVYNPSALVAADLNADGSIDLAVASTETNYLGLITIFLNDGEGNFSSNTVIQVGTTDDYNYLSSLVAGDFSGDGKMDLVVANYTTATLTVLTQTSQQKTPPPAPVVSLTSPTNGQFFPTNASFTLKATAQNAVGVGFYVDGVLLGTTTGTGPTFVFQVPAGVIAPGGHVLEAVAANSAGITATSAPVQITLNVPGTALIDFDILNTSAGAVGGKLLANYLAAYGVTIANVTLGTAMEAVDTNSFTGNTQVQAPSSPNIFTQAGLNQPVSFTLSFATNLQAFGFTRAGLASSSGQASHPQWTATAFDANGTELSSVTEGLIVNAPSVPQRSFVLTGNGIASVRFDSDNQQTAAFTAVLLDNLLLDYNSVTPALSVALSVTSPATNDIVAPAAITLNASVNDQLGASYTVSFYAGASLLGTVSSAPYQLTVNNVLPGNYALQARVLDLSSGISALSPVLPITVQLEADSTLVNFDSLNTAKAPASTAPVEKYLAGFDITVAGLSPGTTLTVDRQQHIAGGGFVLAPSQPNLLTQTGSNGPVQFTLRFASLLKQFGFTRPELLANPFVSHPAWQVTAFDGSGAIVQQVGEAEIDSSTNVGAREFSLSEANGPGIAMVQFSSRGTGLNTFNGMLLDNFILTTNPATAHFPPAVGITSPVSGLALPKPPALNITAAAYDAAGIAGVSFYNRGGLIGTATTSPYSFQLVRPRPGSYVLTAVALNTLGLSWTSAVVNVLIQPQGSQFAIVTPPASQSVPAGGSATFSVVTTGAASPTYQWYFDGSFPITGATASTLVVGPGIISRKQGDYTVAVTSQGVTLTSAPPAYLTVIPPPTIATQPEGTNVQSGTDVNLSVVGGSGGPFTYQWLLNGNSIPGATASSYLIPLAQPRQSGNYQVVVANQAASTLSTIAPVIVETVVTVPETNITFETRAAINPLLGPISDSNDLASVEKGAPLPDGVPGGNSIWFKWTPAFTGTVTLTTQGSDFDTVMAVYTGTALSNLKAVAADDDSGGYLTSLVTFNVTAGTTYAIAVDGHQGKSGRVVLGLPGGSGYRILNPTSGDSVPVILKNPVSQTVAPGATANLSVLFSSATPSACQWNFQGVPIHGATGSTLQIQHLHPGSVGLYNVLVANTVGSVLSEPASVQISANVGGKVVSTGSKFVTTSNTSSPADLATVLRPYDLGGDTAGFSVSQVFSTVGASSEPGEPQPCGQVGGASQWFVYTAPGNGMMQINTDGSTFNTLLGVYTGSGTSFASLDEVGCGYSTNYASEGQPSVVLPNVAKGTTFFILLEGFQGASGVAQLQIGLGQPLSFRTTPTSQLVTAGANATFTATAIGGTPLSYQWQLNGANLAGATKSSYIVTAAQNSQVGNYTVVASNIIGAITSTPPAELTVQFAPAIVAGPSNVTVALGQSAKFSVEAVGVNVRTNPFVCQWYFNGLPIPKATGLSLLLSPTRWTNIGSYYVVVSNSYGSVISAPATLNLVDKVAPKVVITSPVTAVTNANMVTVAGTASDLVGVTNVQVEVGTNGYQNAAGTNNWTIQVALTSGVNVISARSFNVSGVVSVVAKRNITYNSGSSIREPLARRTVRSILPNASTYSGLFYPNTGASLASSGFFTATIASGGSGMFSADILLDGGSYPFVGKFDSSGNAECTVPRTGKTPLKVSLDFDSSSNQITGGITSGDWRSVLRASRALFDSATANVAGQFALVVPSGAAAPAGYLSITNTAGGTALVTGTLADGADIFRAATKVQGPAIPFYTPLYSGQGLFLGWITFTNSPAWANPGPAIWIGPGFTNLTDIIVK